MKDKFKRLKLISFILRLISPGYSTCNVCGLPWNYCIKKVVEYSSSSGFFATCQHCWDNSPIDIIEDAYEQMYRNHKLTSINHNIGYDPNIMMSKVKEEYNKRILLNRINKIKNIKNKIK